MPDKRSGKIVFVSHCLLDQNARFPGIAVQPGPVAELVRGLAEAGVGIEQLPCPEMRYWGGAGRRLAFFPLPRLLVSLLLPPAKALYTLACTWEARRIARTVRDFRQNGYRILGMVAVNDSPTCGLDRTLRLTPYLLKAARTSSDLSRILPGLLEEGSGYFMRALRKEVGAVDASIRFLPFDPWGDAGTEVERILRELASD